MHYGRELTNGISLIMTRRHAVAQLLESLRYKPEGCGFDSLIFPYCVLGVDSVSNRNEYQEYFLGGKSGLCVGLTTLPPSCAEIWEPQPRGTLRACPSPYRDCFTNQLLSLGKCVWQCFWVLSQNLFRKMRTLEKEHFGGFRWHGVVTFSSLIRHKHWSTHSVLTLYIYSDTSANEWPY
jgi:hypothetical protein